MTAFQALVLGIVQGLTEFLPVSSSGHLVLVPAVLGWKFESEVAFIFDVLVQWGTLVAVIAYFWEDLRSIVEGLMTGLKEKRIFTEPQARLAWLILIASLPAAIAGLLIKPLVENAFDRPIIVSIFLIINAITLFSSERVGRFSRQLQDIRLVDAILIGMAQILALFPGISRSGVTIAAGIVRNIDRRDAARFSFLMALPVMIGAGVITLLDLFKAVDAAAQIGPLLVGVLGATVVGYLAIRWLIKFLSQKSLMIFVVYCAVVGGVGVLLGAMHG
jgi:undecaprenyl-diphosphatase